MMAQSFLAEQEMYSALRKWFESIERLTLSGDDDEL
jgi:hypothetical protein